MVVRETIQQQQEEEVAAKITNPTYINVDHCLLETMTNNNAAETLYNNNATTHIQKIKQ